MNKIHAVANNVSEQVKALFCLLFTAGRVLSDIWNEGLIQQAMAVVHCQVALEISKNRQVDE